MIFVLESAYNYSRQEVLDALEELMLLTVLEFEKREGLQNLLVSARENIFDLSDLLIAECALADGCQKVITLLHRCTVDRACGPSPQPLFHLHHQYDAECDSANQGPFQK